MPENANTRKTDEVENVKFSESAQKTPVGWNLLLTLDTFSKATLIRFVNVREIFADKRH